MALVAAGGLTAAVLQGRADTAGEDTGRFPAERPILCLILAVGAVLRGIDLNDGLWYDEIGALVRYVRLPLSEIVTRFDTQNQHLLYSILAHVAVRLFGEHPWTLRLPAAVFGVLSLWAVWWLGVRIAGRREALVAAGLLAVSSHHVWFSQDARGYTMLMFFSVVGTRLFLDLLERGERRTAAGYAIIMALACWTQVAGAFVVIGHGAVWLYQTVRGASYVVRGKAVSGEGSQALRTTHYAPLWALIGAGLLTVLLYAPVLGAMTHTLAGPRATGGAPQWKSLGWFVSETARGLARGVPGGWITLAVVGVVVAIGLWSYWRASRAATLLLIMPGLVTAVVMLVTAHNLWPRLFFFALGFAALIAVRGGFELCRRAFKQRGELVATAGAVLAGAFSLFTVPRVWAPKQDFGAALAWVSRASGAEPVVTVDMTRLPYRDYYHTSFVAVDSVAQIGTAQRALGHAWVLVTFPERLQAVDTATWNLLQCCYQEMKRFRGTVEGGAIQVMRNR